MRRLQLTALCALFWLQGCATPAPDSAAACTSTAPHASYTGPYLGADNRLPAAALARDVHCASQFKAQKYPQGFVVVFGSSRLGEDAPGTPATEAGQLYQGIRLFARQWTNAHGARLPILTGAGPGIMEAASRGAIEAGGPSIGYTTYYGPARTQADAKLAYQSYRGQPILSDGLIFSSVSVRETMMVLHAAAIVIAPGGTGTEWETFQVLESIKSQQLDPVPVILVGKRDVYWQGLQQRLQEMVRLGTVRAGEVTDLIEFVEDPQQLVEVLATRLSLR